MPIYLAAGISVVLWAHAFVAIGAALRELNPLELTTLRFVPLGLFAAGYAAAFHRKAAAGLWARHRARLFMIGLLLVPVYNLLLYFAQQRLSPALASLLVCTSSLFTWAFAVWTGQERRDLVKLAGVLCAVAGVGIAVRNDLSLGAEPGAALYVLAALGSSISSAAFSIQAKTLLREDEPLTVVALALVVGAVPLLAAATPSFAAKLPELSTGTWLGVLFLAFFCTWIGFYCWFYALKRAPATNIVVAGSLIPLIAMFADMFWRSGPFKPGFLLGGAISAVGIALTSWHRPIRAAAPVPGAAD